MAHCCILAFYKSEEGLANKLQILRQLGFEPLLTIKLNSICETKEEIKQFEFDGFLGVVDQLVTIDSLSWEFPDAKPTKIFRMFSSIVLCEIELALQQGFSVSKVLCST